MRRYRIPKAKPGELKIAYGPDYPGEPPDVCFCWGPGVSKRDSNLLHYHIGSPKLELVIGEDEIRANGGRQYKFGKSLLEELGERGYDLSTLKFSIQKKQPAVLPESASSDA